MTLDYSTGSVNFRDVGACVNRIMQSDVMLEGRLFRGGLLLFRKQCSTSESFIK